MNFIKKFLNSITMYRLVLWSLIILVGFSIIFSIFGVISYGVTNLLATLINLIIVTFLTNKIFAKLLKVPVNQESWLITALILFFLLPPATDLNSQLLIAAISAVAMAGKYFIVIKHKHLFNPAAFAAVTAGLVFAYYPIWWIGSLYFFPITLIAALLIYAKIRRFHMLTSFLITNLIVIFIYSQVKNINFLEHLDVTLRSWPLFFFAGIMLTEPYTAPARKKNQTIYGAIVAALSSWPFFIGPIYSSPELALLIGNLFSAIVTFQPRLKLSLKEKNRLTESSYEYVFSTDKNLNFKSGQYLEWTLPHKNPDNRGVRRYFTIASGENDKNIKLGVKFNSPSSSFKKVLKSLKKGQVITAGEVEGDFILPQNPESKICFIAGGIGITPFISHLRSLITKSDKRKITLFYGNKSIEETAYLEFLKKAGDKLNLKVVHCLTTPPEKRPKDLTIEKGRVTGEVLKKHCKHSKNSVYYISGPSVMVDHFKNKLKETGVKRAQIKTDYFPGFA